MLTALQLFPEPDLLFVLQLSHALVSVDTHYHLLISRLKTTSKALSKLPAGAVATSSHSSSGPTITPSLASTLFQSLTRLGHAEETAIQTAGLSLLGLCVDYCLQRFLISAWQRKVDDCLSVLRPGRRSLSTSWPMSGRFLRRTICVL